MIVLFRIDDRLIHGQVILGWGSALKPDRIVLADDEVASNDWEKNLYASSVPPEIKVSILSLTEAAAQIKRGIFDTEKVILLVRHPRCVVALMDLGVSVGEVNVGGMHYRDGREKVLDNVYVDADERAIMRDLVKRGVTLDGRALPGSRAATLNSRVV
ncbi:MAG: PTS sugar transporter subunit IIB [Candidatus Krumholzibacteria bacterium]|nr:PTS sugar transporter subunit IIB [Candidatus Krumholzibacteria bacterium]